MGADYSGRLRKLKKAMKKEGIDAAMVSSIRDIEYFTGYCCGLPPAAGTVQISP